MNRNIKFLVLSLVAFAFSLNLFSQATAAASATIVAPITITKTVDLSFGNIVPGAGAGTVVLSTAGGRTPSGVTLPAITGSVTAASFNVGGQANLTYSIAIAPASVNITDGTNIMAVNAFNSNPTTGTGGTLDGSGTQTILVGATLNVGAAQPAGAYTNATAFTVTVNYN